MTKLSFMVPKFSDSTIQMIKEHLDTITEDNWRKYVETVIEQ